MNDIYCCLKIIGIENKTPNKRGMRIFLFDFSFKNTYKIENPIT